MIMLMEDGECIMDEGWMDDNDDDDDGDDDDDDDGWMDDG